MPRKPKRPCSYPGCPNLTDSEYCKEHEAAARRQYNKYERSADVNKKYGRAWKRIRDRYAAAHPLCEMCLKEGRLTPVATPRSTTTLATGRAVKISAGPVRGQRPGASCAKKAKSKG